MKNCLFIALLGLLASCGTFEEIALDTTANMMIKGQKAALWTRDEANLAPLMATQTTTIEVLAQSNTKNTKALHLLTKAYAAQGTSVYELEYMLAKGTGKGVKLAKDKLMGAYSRSVDYGLQWFELKNIKYSELPKIMREKSLVEYFDQALHNDQQNLEQVFTFAQSLGSIIRMNMEDMLLVAQLPLVEQMAKWSCKHDPKLLDGACALFEAALMASRPRTLGGNPKKAEVNFKKFMDENPGHILAKAFYTEFILIPQKRASEFKSLYASSQKAWSQETEVNVINPLDPKDFREKNYLTKNLFDALGIKKMRLFNQFRSKTFQ